MPPLSLLPLIKTFIEMYFDSNCLLLFTGFLITVIKAEIQNACKSYAGYSARLNCFHNPDVDSYTVSIFLSCHAHQHRNF